MAIPTPITQDTTYTNVPTVGFVDRPIPFGTHVSTAMDINVDATVPRVLHRTIAAATVGATPGATGTLWTYSIPADGLTGRVARLRILMPSFSTFSGDEQIKVKVGGTYLTTIDVDTAVPLEIEVYISASKQVQIVRNSTPVVLSTAASNALTTTAAVELKIDYLGATDEALNCTAVMVLVELL